jgi:hypothetical protein
MSDFRTFADDGYKMRAVAPASADVVRRVVLEAASEHPELVGWKSAICGAIERVYLEHPNGMWRHFGDVRRDTLANLLADARTLAEQAATAWHKEQAQRPITSEQASAGCPVCQALVGFLPHCRECRPNPSGAPLEAQPQAPTD